MSRVARAMATAMRVAGVKEGDGEGGKGVWQGKAMATKRSMATAMRVAGDEEGYGVAKRSQKCQL